VILYSMITGFRPFQGNSAQTVCFKVMNVEPVPVTSFQHEVPPELDAIISRAIAKDPDERYQSGAEMAREIQRFRESDSSLAEETRSFARLVQTGRSTAPSNRKLEQGAYHKFFLGVALSSNVFAGLLFAWRVTRVQNTPLSAQALSDARSISQVHVPPPPMTSPVAAPVRNVGRQARHSKPQPSNKPPQPVADQAPQTARVQIEIQHHFKTAKASIWFDDELVFDQALRGAERHALLRIVEMNQIASFQFAPGKHWLQVRVMSPANTYDQIETLDADLTPGSEHVLHVNCDKRKMQVTLQ
jgi:serine/threonine protein kinase